MSDRTPGRYTDRSQIIAKIDKVRELVRLGREDVERIFIQRKEAIKMRDAFESVNNAEEAEIWQNQIDKLQDDADKIGKLASYREDVFLKHLGEKLAEFNTIKFDFLPDASVPVKMTVRKA